MRKRKSASLQIFCHLDLGRNIVSGMVSNSAIIDSKSRLHIEDIREIMRNILVLVGCAFRAVNFPYLESLLKKWKIRPSEILKSSQHRKTVQVNMQVLIFSILANWPKTLILCKWQQRQQRLSFNNLPRTRTSWSFTRTVTSVFFHLLKGK